MARGLEKICSYNGSSEIEPHNIVDFLQDTDVKITKITNVPDIYKKNDIRMTLDYTEDFEFFKSVIEYFGSNEFTSEQLFDYLDDNKDVIEINYLII